MNHCAEEIYYRTNQEILDHVLFEENIIYENEWNVIAGVLSEQNFVLDNNNCM